MGYVGAGFVVNQANTTDGGAINTVAYASTGASAGQYVGGAYAVNLYTGPFGTLSLDFINNYYAIVGVSKTFSQVITFSRASNATRFAPDGVLQYAPHNLLLYSEQFDNAAWTKTRSSITANAIVSPNGTLDADKLVGDTTAEQSHFIVQSVAQTGAHTLSIYAKQGEISGFLLWGIGATSFAAGFNLALGTTYLEAISGVVPPDLGTNIVDVGNGWFRCSISFTANAGTSVRIVLDKDLNGDATYTGDGVSGIYIWGAQLAVGSYPLDYTPTTTAVVYGPRFDYNPTTLAPLGLLIEEQRTNSIRNNTMVGAVAGTPGTAPTNWSVTGTAAGVAIQIVGTGTENGITYIDIRYSGTATATSFKLVRFEAVNNIAAASGQTWTAATYMRIAAGSTANFTGFEHQVVGYTAGGAVSEQTNTPPVLTATMTRFITSRTLNNATTAFVTSWFALTFNNGAVVDLTLRIGLPQLELGAFATSVIPTSTAAVTRSADVASINTLSPWYNATEGTLVLRGIYRYIASGSPGFFRFDDGTDNERMMFAIASGTQRFTVIDGGTEVVDISRSGVAAETAFTHSAAYKVNDFASCVNGGVVGTDTVGTIPTVTRAIFRRSASSDYPNGWLQRISYYNRRLTNAELQAITS